jgi:hypothetical protein
MEENGKVHAPAALPPIKGPTPRYHFIERMVPELVWALIKERILLPGTDPYFPGHRKPLSYARPHLHNKQTKGYKYTNNKYSLLVCDVVQAVRNLPTFRRHMPHLRAGYVAHKACTSLYEQSHET